MDEILNLLCMAESQTRVMCIAGDTLAGSILQDNIPFQAELLLCASFPDIQRVCASIRQALEQQHSVLLIVNAYSLSELQTSIASEFLAIQKTSNDSVCAIMMVSQGSETDVHCKCPGIQLVDLADLRTTILNLKWPTSNLPAKNNFTPVTVPHSFELVPQAACA
jgi:hypothetical protein